MKWYIKQFVVTPGGVRAGVEAGVRGHAREGATGTILAYIIRVCQAHEPGYVTCVSATMCVGGLYAECSMC